MKKTRTYILLTACLLVSLAINAQGFLHTEGQNIVNENGDNIILRGMGLGGWMLQEGYMLQTASFANSQHKIRARIEELIGEADTDEFYEAWLSNHVTKRDIDSLKSWGFNSVRLPMHYNLFTLPIEDEPVPGEQTWLETGFILTDSLISWCAQNEMYVILDMHAAPGGQGYDEGISDYDPNKPSLWESFANQQKLVALWRNLAERYVDETWIAGYDLINEPNWDLPGGTLLRSMYEDVTAAIREVDNNHIIFIEGNWFANDFTGLTPPWDANMVYSPHKYWSFNDQSTMQWVLNIREQHDVPLYLGESGENSNLWFKEAIELLEDLNIGWAWWPMKKIESIAGPLSVVKTPEYQTLLNYWNNGGTVPSSSFARATMMEITENLLMENCIYQKDVIDAMFRQREEDTAIPFRTQTIPGIVYATDFDLGVPGIAYSDSDVANYQVSTGNFTAWNQGWAYRNDGVDIENSSADQGNGYNVGFIDDNEWMQYDVNVTSSAAYEVRVKVASATGGGNFYFTADGAAVSIPFYVATTGGWQSWQDRVITNVILDSSIEKLRFHAPEGGYNLSHFEFVELGPTTDVVADYLSATTLDPSTIELYLNKPMMNPLGGSLSDFQIYANGAPVEITEMVLNLSNTRTITFTTNFSFTSDDIIKISYDGTEVSATDGTSLESFFFKNVQNNLSQYLPIPGRIEAEDFSFQTGIALEPTTDTGGGQNIGFLDVGDYLEYEVNVAQEGRYQLDARTASDGHSGGFELFLLDENGDASSLGTPSFTSTEGWQIWETQDAGEVILPTGVQILRLVITQPQFNVNWMDFSYAGPTATEEIVLEDVQLFPNPSTGQFMLKAQLPEQQNALLRVFDNRGSLVYQQALTAAQELQEVLNLHFLPDGVYHLRLQTRDGGVFSKQLIKMTSK